jgi:hypothetical protein
MAKRGRFLLIFSCLFFQVYLSARVYVGSAGGLYVSANTVITIPGNTAVQHASVFTVDEIGKARFRGILI